MRPGNKIMLVSVVCFLAIFKSVSSADPTTAPPASMAVNLKGTEMAMKACGAEDYATFKPILTTAKNALHLQSENLHGLRACVTVDAASAVAVCPDQATTQNMMKLKVGAAADAESATNTLSKPFLFSAISNMMYCTLFTPAEVATLLASHKATDVAIELSVEVKSFGGAAAGKIQVSLESVPVVIATEPTKKEIMLGTSGKYHEFICKVANCVVVVPTTTGVDVTTHVCTPGATTMGPTCAMGKMTAVANAYTVTSIHCASAACPKSVTVENMTGLVMEMSMPKTVAACGTATVTDSVTTKAHGFTSKDIRPLLACGMFSKLPTKCAAETKKRK